ncbi:MAG: endonuclease/exonuclease/phosphatase family protein [Actinomycetia bacterium]|nr:endonuclease/exonuclease/phosphatase family protein [Actinomycetes bacterium]
MERSWQRALPVVAALMLGLTACTSEEAEQDSAKTSTLRVMQFNIEYGGTVVDFDGVPAAIEAADADVVAVQEGYGAMPKLAKALGWRYYDARTQTVSQYPLITPGDPSYPEVLVAIEPGRTVAVINVHLPSAPYGPNRAAAGASAQELVDGEQGRLKAIEPALDAVERLAAEGTPVVLTGDFNAPSHLDWNESTNGVRDHVIAVEWPVSIAVEGAGLTDVYRTAYPDPVADEGLTWPASRPTVGAYNPGPAGKPADRIDQMYVSDDVVVASADVVGEANAEVTDIVATPWPSDHRGMVAELEVSPASAPPYVSPAQRLVELGAQVDVFVHADSPPTSVVLTAADGDRTVTEIAEGKAVVDTTDLASGAYELAAEGPDGSVVATNRLWVHAVGAEPTVAVGDARYGVGKSIDVRWQDAPGNKWDWLGVYKRGADPNVAWYKLWTYTDAAIEGTATIDDGVDGGPWPLPPGRYDVILLADDSYQELARASFVIKGPG